MPNYKMVDADILDGAMLETAKAIREKGGTEELIAWNKSTGYKDAIEAIKGGGYAQGAPDFTYSGDYTLLDDGEENWRIKFLTSGTLAIVDDGSDVPVIVDIFAVGGGASGASGDEETGGGGGGSGYTTTRKEIELVKGAEYEIIIGDGGTAVTSANGINGGATSFGGSIVTANGGVQGVTGWGAGGNGGSGGASRDGTTGGSDGGNGTGSRPGTGQGTTTREFGETTGALYASGGNDYDFKGASESGDNNSGDGGSGSPPKIASGAGGSGIVIIRNTRGSV